MRIGLLHTDPDELSRLAQALAGTGHEPVPFVNGQALAAHVANIGADILLMRWDGADLSGVALMHRLRGRMAPAPGIILIVDSAAPGGIAEGADATLVEPWTPDSLALAIQKVLQHRGLHHQALPKLGALLFDDTSAQVTVLGVPVQLTAKEYALAQLLLNHVGKPLSRSEIMTSVWGRQEQPGSRTLDAHIAQIRKRLLLRPDHGWRLSSVYGFGYRLDRVVDPLTAPVASATP